MIGDAPSAALRRDEGTVPAALGGMSSFTEHDEPLDWTPFLGDAHGGARGAGEHRRTFSAPPTLKSLHAVHPGLAGKRPERSPRAGVFSSVGGAPDHLDPFHDIRSPVYKKHLPADELLAGSENSSFVSREAPTVRRAEGGLAGHRARAHSFDTAVYELEQFADVAKGGGASKARRGGAAHGRRNHACAPADNGSGETAGQASKRDTKTVPWTSTEDKVICEGVEMHGFKWSLISLSLPGRTDNAVRNRWHRLEQARRWREEVQAQYHAVSADGDAPANPLAMPGSAFPGYKCRRCGQPKRGHVCPYEDTTQLPAPRPLALPTAARSSKAGRSADEQHALERGAEPRALAEHTAPHGYHVPLHAARAASEPRAYRQPPALQRPASAKHISVVPPSSTLDFRAAMLAAQLPTPSPQRYLLEHLGSMPLSAHLRALESGVDGEMVNVGDLGVCRARALAPPARAVPRRAAPCARSALRSAHVRVHRAATRFHATQRT